MEQDRIQTNRTTLELFFRKLFIKNALWSLAISGVLLTLFFPLFLKMTVDRTYADLNGALGSSFRILVETINLPYHSLHKTLSDRIIDDHHLVSVNVVKDLSEGWFCYHIKGGRICISNGSLTYYFPISWAQDKYYVECVSDVWFLDYRTAIVIFVLFLAFSMMNLFLFLAINSGVRVHISKPLQGMWNDFKDNGGEKFSSSLDEIYLLEISELYVAIRNHSNMERQLVETAKKAAVFRAIAETTQMVAHDVRRPVDMTRKFARRLLMLPESEIVSYARKSAPLLEQEATEVYGMLEDLIDISTGRYSCKTEQMNVDALIREVILHCDIQAVDVKCEKSLECCADRLKMKRVLGNILSNAFQAAIQPAHFWVYANAEGRNLKIEVGNTGSMIPASNLERIFETFYTATKNSGKGLGMAIARKFVEDHNGSIWCESNAQSLGKLSSHHSSIAEDYVIFHIVLPLDDLENEKKE